MSTLRRTSGIVPEMSVSGIPETHIFECPVLGCTRNVRFWYTRNGHFRMPSSGMYQKCSFLVYQNRSFSNAQFWDVPEMASSGILETVISGTIR